jgi:NTP pyrophosphatase (non-canonical NTP hydrolase)
VLEVAELAEAVRGKQGNPVQEAGDVLLALASLLEAHNIPMESVIEEAHRKIDALMDAPRYWGEHFGGQRRGK